MAKSLVLAEKPSVARELAKVLGCRQNGQGFISGGQYIVTWALGHLVTLADPEQYDKKWEHWSLETLPMLPKTMQLVVMKETGKQFRTVQELLRRSEVSEIIIATDSGREGELVARWILMKAGCKKPCKRLWISSQTDKAIREGFANLRPSREYDNLFYSAQARSEADWLVGLNITRALTCHFGAQLSAGRVQTPTLAMIVQREQEIREFVPREFFTLHARFEGFSAMWMDGKGQGRLFDKTAAEALLAKVKNAPATITQVKRQYKHTSPPAAYDLTELQRDANKKYAYSAKQTLSLMQSLYEQHKILTYPRTDSRYITRDIVPTLPDRLAAMAVGPYKEMARALRQARPIETRFLVNDARVTDHHAIIPTEEPLQLHALSPEERNIYDLVARRFLAVLSAPYEYEEVRVTLQAGKENFHAKGKTVKSYGWKEAYNKSMETEEDGEDDLREQLLPSLQQGDKPKMTACKVESGRTAPPARYNEATLLTAMENPSSRGMSREHADVLKTTSGLGTPATRADIIEKLLSVFYIERQGKSLVPTSKGIQLISLVPEDLKSAELTAKWEQELARIAKGEAKRDAFVDNMRGYARRLVSQVAASTAQYVHDNVTREVCPDCGKYLLEVKGKKGLMHVCPDRECGFRKSIIMQTNARCPNCHKRLELRGQGEKRIFTCICGFREKLSDFEKKRQTSSASKGEVRRFMEEQDKGQSGGSNDMAAQLAKWMESNKK